MTDHRVALAVAAIALAVICGGFVLAALIWIGWLR